MQVTPRSEKEIAEANLLQPGAYDFEVVKAEDAVSKGSGADMIKLTLNVFDHDGGTRLLFDYLLDAMPAKLRHAAQAFGMLAEYERGMLASDRMPGKVGKIKVGIKKDKGGQYPDQNNVVDYMIDNVPNAPTSRLGPKRQPAMATAGAFDDSEIPF